MERYKKIIYMLFDLYINGLIKVSLTFSQQSLIAYAGDLIIISKDLNKLKSFIKLAKHFFKCDN